MMNGETADHETGVEEAGGETAVTAAQPQTAGGEIVGGTWVNPNAPGHLPQRAAMRGEVSYTLPDGRPSLVRALFGGVIILTDELGDWTLLENDEEVPGQLLAARLRQAAEQQEGMAERPFANLRYGTIGLLGGALDAMQGGAGRMSYLTDATARTAGKIIGPVWNSFLFAPLHEPVMRVEKAGEEKVNEWVARGRVEEVRSRALAEVGFNNFVEDSVSELTANAQVQMIVQQVIASQSTSLLTEIITEIRERVVSLDLAFLARLRRETVAAPGFRETYLREMEQKRPHLLRGELNRSMAGTYAGPLGRLIAFLIDVVLLIFVYGLISTLVSSALELFGLTNVVTRFLLSGGLISTAVLILVLLFNFLLVGGYFVLSWNLTGATVGDLLLGLKVVNNEGHKISFARSILRLVGGVVSAVALFLGFIWALFDRRRQGWHDKFGGTFVLYDWPARPDEEFLRGEVRAASDPMSG